MQRKGDGARYSICCVTDLLHRLGFSYEKPTHVHGKQDMDQQRAFLKEYERISAGKGPHDPANDTYEH